MPSRAPAPIPHDLAQRWCDLAERRVDYFRELFQTGRWKHYYSEREFILRMRDVMAAVENWRSLAGREPGFPS